MARNTGNQIKYKKLARRRRRLKIIKTGIVTVLVLAAMVLFVYLCQIKTVEIKGNEKYTAEMIHADIIHGRLAGNTLYHRVRDLFKKKENIPYLTTYEMDYTGLNKVTITVYEKQPVAYFESGGEYVLFDSDGLVLQISTAQPTDIALVEGLEAEAAVLFDTLPAKDAGLFKMLKNLVGQLEKNRLSPDRILINDKEEMELFFGEVNVKLGTDNALENKIARLIAMLPTLEGKSGILYMEDVDENTDKISFIKTR